MAHHIFEIYRADTGKPVGYLSADEEEIATTMQKAGFIVDRVEV